VEQAEPVSEYEADDESAPPGPSDAEWEAAAEASEETATEELSEPPGLSEA
jgi:hypothetical protein